MLEQTRTARAPSRSNLVDVSSAPRRSLRGGPHPVLTLAWPLAPRLASGGAGDEPPSEPTAGGAVQDQGRQLQHPGLAAHRAPRRLRPRPGPRRYTARLIHDSNIEVIGIQEVQWDQLVVLGRELDDYWIWPYKRLGKAQGLRLQIAYKRDDYEFVEGRHLYTRFDGNTRPIPYVRLRDKASGQEFWYLTFHNSRHFAERNGATARMVDLVNELRGDGIPVVLGGDSNTWYDFACRMGRYAAMQNAAGGRLYPCRPPDNPVFDVLMANPRVVLGRYRQLGGREMWRASDHKLLTAKVRLAPEEG